MTRPTHIVIKCKSNVIRDILDVLDERKISFLELLRAVGELDCVEGWKAQLKLSTDIGDRCL